MLPRQVHLLRLDVHWLDCRLGLNGDKHGLGSHYHVLSYGYAHWPKSNLGLVILFFELHFLQLPLEMCLVASWSVPQAGPQ